MEVLPELPKTAVGKVFKPDLRRMAIARTYDAALAEAGISAHVTEVVEDKKRGLVARLAKSAMVDDEAVKSVLGQFSNPWEWAA
jgi:fatty-acyl-CoA synthase